MIENRPLQNISGMLIWKAFIVWECNFEVKSMYLFFHGDSFFSKFKIFFRNFGKVMKSWNNIFLELSKFVNFGKIKFK